MTGGNYLISLPPSSQSRSSCGPSVSLSNGAEIEDIANFDFEFDVFDEDMIMNDFIDTMFTGEDDTEEEVYR